MSRLVLVALLVGCGPGESGTDERSTDAGGPDAEDSSFGGTFREWHVAMVDCLVEDGYPAILEESGGRLQIGFEAGFDATAQEEALETAFLSCESSVGEFDVPPLDDAGYRLLYDRQLEQHSCLVALGHDMSPAPTFEAWHDEVSRGQPSSWVPILDVPVDDQADAQNTCPPPTYPGEEID